MDEQQKQRVMMAIVAFNIVIIAFQIIFNSGLFGFPFSVGRLLIGLVIAAVVGGIGYVVAGLMQR